MDKKRVLILDADHKNTLAIVRHLGKTKKFILDVAGHNKNSLSFYSKYTNKKIITSNPYTASDKFYNELIDILTKTSYLTLIPVSFKSFQICSKNKKEISTKTHLTIADYKHIEIASSKIKTYEVAKKLGVPYPEITKIKSKKDIELLNIEYPVVIKAPYEAGKNIVEYAFNKQELIKKYFKIYNENNFKDELPFIQKYIVGEGAGFFAYYKNGKCINYFMHKRIREYPVTGGASTAAESYYNKEIFEYGKKILDYLDWNGVAMVEFKRDNTTGVYNLMEINAKFWGSLDLALVSGVNFPLMLIYDALKEPIPRMEYKRQKFQWILNGEIFHILEKPKDTIGFIKDLFTARNDIWLKDLKPNLFQLVYIPIHYYKKFKK